MQRSTLAPICLVLAFFAIALTPAESQQQHSAAANYGKLPLSFEANQGQADASVQFLAHGQGYTLFLRPGEAVLGLSRASSVSKAKTLLKADKSPAYEGSVVQLKLVGADTHAKASAEDEQITKTNYFFGKDPAKWRSDIPNYAQVRYHAVYPGIDMLYYGNQSRLEHDFIVASGADAGQIVLAVNSGTKAHIDSTTGDLVLTTATGEVRLLKPVTYQAGKDAGAMQASRTEVVSSYKLLAGNRVGFSIGDYDHAQPLVIDPVLSYSTYLGGAGSGSYGDQGNAIAVDASGSAYITGTTYSTDFPTTAGSFAELSNYTPQGMAFVSKLSADGSSLVYSTYLGGSNGNQGYGIALDAVGEAYITGVTNSSDFPVTCGAFQTVFSSKNNTTVAFVTRLNSTGSSLIYSTYLGGSGSTAGGDVAQSVAVDSAGNAYIAGYTWSSDFPTTEKAFQPDFAGSGTHSNAFITKLNGVGTAQIYSTYLGGSGSAAGGDVANSLALDAAGNAYIAGTTGSLDFPVTDGALQTSNNGGSTNTNGFVTELNSAGASEVFSTYLGGSGGDSAVAVAVDGPGYTFVAGNTASADFPVTSGVVEGSSYGENAAYLTSFVSRIAPGGGSLAYSTHLEGRITTINGMAIDSSGNAYLVGSANAQLPNQFAGFVTTSDALTTPTSVSSSAFLVKLNATATAFNYATLLGGSGSDSALAVAVDASGNAYLTGNAASTDFPITSGAFEPKPDKPSGTRIPVTISVLSQQVTCSNSTFTLTVNAQISSDASKPSPVGTASIEAPFYNGQTGIALTPGSSGSSTVIISATSPNSVCGGSGSVPWSLFYSGDSLHAAAEYDGTYNGSLAADGSISGVSGKPSGAGAASHSSLTAHGTAAGAQPLIAAAKPLASTTAFVSKFALASEKNTTTYPNVPAALNTFIVVDSQSWTSEAYCLPGTDSITVVASIYTNQIGPALGGAAVLYDSNGFSDTNDFVYEGVPEIYGTAELGILNGSWSLYYQGDSTWSPSSLSGNAPLVCPNSTNAALGQSPQAVRTHIQIAGAPHIAAAKFTPPATTALSSARPAAQSQATPGCIAPINLKPLTIRISNAGRLYGTANPVIGYSLTGLSAGDTVTVTPTPNATVTSPVGTYPISASVSGSNLANYDVQIIPGTLTVLKAPLYLSAKNVAVTYGETPSALNAYSITGFLNGDTASVVSGNAALSTTVTAATPVGIYPITVGIGSLTAQNYYFDNFSSGEGSVQVYKAPLHIKPASATIHAGDPLPAFTYTLSGFVNGDTQGSATTGAASLSTTAPTPTKVGRYYIIGAQGSLQSTNYYFLSYVPDYGILTVLP